MRNSRNLFSSFLEADFALPFPLPDGDRRSDALSSSMVKSTNSTSPESITALVFRRFVVLGVLCAVDGMTSALSVRPACPFRLQEELGVESDVRALGPAGVPV